MATHEASSTPSPQPQNPPAPLTPAWLRAHFDSLPFPARSGALARYARTLAPGAYETLHRTLDHGDAADRHTALFLAVVRRDLERVAAALADPLLGRRARAAAIRLPVPEPALERLALSDIRAVRHDTYRLLRLSRRTALAARLLPQVHERHGGREAAALLPACPPETVTDWLPRVEPAPGILNSLARTAPYAVATYLTAQYAHWPQQFARRHRAVASLAARRDPRAALLLLDRTPLLLTPAAVLSALSRPAEALAVLRTPHPGPGGRGRARLVPAGPLPPSLRRTLLALPPRDLLELAEHCTCAGRRSPAEGRTEIIPDTLLALLPPAERRRVVEKHTSGMPRPVPALLSELAALEAADRADLVRPLAAGSERRPWGLARSARALPLAEGEPLLRTLADNHRVQHRSLAWPALLVCAELEGDPEQFARIATDCERAWHDQDAVRRPALEQLAGTSKQLLDAIPERVLRDAVLTTVQSRDSTAGTVRAARRLLFRVVERAAASGATGRAANAAGLLGELATAPGQTEALPPLYVDEPTARAIWTATAPTALRRPEVGTAVAELLARHLTTLPELDAETRRLAVECDDPHLAARAAAVWVAPPRLRERRCAELVALDPTFATVPVVLRTLATRRTDLLDLVRAAAREAFTGRLRAGRTPWAPRLAPGVTGRWLPAQRDAWEEHHARVALDESAPLRVRADAAQALRDPERLTALAEHAPQPVAAAALRALGEAPDRDAVALLLRHAGTGGVRGRAAMASVRRLIARRPDDDAVPLLAPVVCAADSPVGARKEAVRALADLDRRTPSKPSSRPGTRHSSTRTSAPSSRVPCCPRSTTRKSPTVCGRRPTRVPRASASSRRAAASGTRFRGSRTSPCWYGCYGRATTTPRPPCARCCRPG
ncbi:HEAT repeat domain-containing protein [Streptomyces sp. RG80]|uniref:HEAT repeat domain-containing protein n=1 Tax=Streptomyces sp. RG80 TaxID=3157340 RepID=UPI00338FF9F3